MSKKIEVLLSFISGVKYPFGLLVGLYMALFSAYLSEKVGLSMICALSQYVSLGVHVGVVLLSVVSGALLLFARRGIDEAILIVFGGLLSLSYIVLSVFWMLLTISPEIYVITFFFSVWETLVGFFFVCDNVRYIVAIRQLSSDSK